MLFFQKNEEDDTYIDIKNNWEFIDEGYHKNTNFGQINKKGRSHGIVRAVFEDLIVEGQFANGRVNGWCRRIFDSGECVEYGWYKTGKANGFVKIY